MNFDYRTLLFLSSTLVITIESCYHHHHQSPPPSNPITTNPTYVRWQRSAMPVKKNGHQSIYARNLLKILMSKVILTEMGNLGQAVQY